MSAASATPLSTPRIVAIVDPISTGAQLAKYLANRGYDLVRVFSDIIPDSVKGLVAEGLEVDWLVTIQHEGRASATARALKGLGVTDVIVGSEPGVTLHVHLAAEFGADLPAEKLELRRNKYLQSEAVRAAGIEVEADAVRQASRMYGHTLADLLALTNISVLTGHTGTQKFESAAKTLRDRPEDVELRIETEGPRTGMWSVVQPQWVTQVRRVR